MEVDRDAITRDNRQISIQLELRANEELSREGLTAMQAHMLRYILRHSGEGTSLTAIHREFGYSMAALSSLLKRLREKGYVRVERCVGDDRRKLLFATEKGCQLQETLDRSMEVLQDRLYDQFSLEELDQLDRMQKKLLRNLAPNREEIQKEVSQS